MLWAIIGDLDYMAAVLGLPRFSSKAAPCSLCRCTGVGPLTWTDCRLSAPWMLTCWAVGAWRAWADRSKNPVFDLPSVSALTVGLDYTHAKYLGMDQYQFGSVLYLLVFIVMQGSPMQNLTKIWVCVKQYYKEHKTPVRHRYLNKLTMFCRKKGFPKLRGKAAEIKYFGKPLLAVWSKWMNPALVVHRRIHLMLKCNVMMEDIMSEHKNDFALPPESATKFKQTAFTMAQLQTQVAEHFLSNCLHEQGQPLFDITSKTHMVLHCALLSGSINPRKTWCFTGEDMMQKGQILFASCAKGDTGPDAVCKGMSHYRLALHLEFLKFADE